MIILRQKNYSILNKIGRRVNDMDLNLSSKELSARSKRSTKKSSPELKNKVLDHISRYNKIKIGDKLGGYRPDQDNFGFKKGHEPQGIDAVFYKPKVEDFEYSRKKRTGFIELNKDSSPFVMAHEHGHGLDFASKGGAQRFTDMLGDRKKLYESTRDAKEMLDSGKRTIGMEVAADINALKLLKKKGASQKELDRAKQEAKAGLRTYKNKIKSNINNAMSDSSLTEDLKFRKEHMRRARKQYRDAVKMIDNMYGPNKLAQKEKAALIGTGAALVGGGIAGGIAIHKHRKKKKGNNNKDKEGENK